MKVMTLNLAHGRGEKLHQWLLNRTAIEANLTSVAAMLRRESPDMVALQEADGPSFWSGNFDHIAHLAEAAGYPYLVRGEHVQRRRLVYGASLLSRLPVLDAVSVTFSRSLSTTSKGFVVGQVAMPEPPYAKVDVVSVHLDFLRPAVRRRQITQIIRSLSERDAPRIILGDFNCAWHTRDQCLRHLAQELELTTYEPTHRRLWTFPRLHRRLDWIFISRSLQFESYDVLPDRLSDHRAVVAKISGQSSVDSGQ